MKFCLLFPISARCYHSRSLNVLMALMIKLEATILLRMIMGAHYLDCCPCASIYRGVIQVLFVLVSCDSSTN